MFHLLLAAAPLLVIFVGCGGKKSTVKKTAPQQPPSREVVKSKSLSIQGTKNSKVGGVEAGGAKSTQQEPKGGGSSKDKKSAVKKPSQEGEKKETSKQSQAPVNDTSTLVLSALQQPSTAGAQDEGGYENLGEMSSEELVKIANK